MKFYIYGKKGKIGEIVTHYCHLMEISLVDEPLQADCWFLAVPSSAVSHLLNQREHRGVIDLSGYCKRHNIGVYGVLDERLNRSSKIIQNPGCFASSVIEAFKRSGLDPHQLDGSVSITSIGGASVAHRSEKSGLRLSKRLWSHPHVKEIESVITGLEISHFTPVITHSQPHGICSLISGKLAQPIHIQSPPPFDLEEILGGSQVKWNWRVDASARRFLLSCVLDNLYFPAHHAVMIAQHLITS